MNPISDESMAMPTAEAAPGVVVRLWRRLPSPLRAVLAGLFVFSVIQNGWFSLFLANVQLAPRIPWSIPLGLVWVLFGLRYFGGWGRPRSTAAAREQGLRGHPVSRAQWVGSALYFVVFLAFMTATLNTVYRFQVIPTQGFDTSSLPWWTLYPALVMISLTAGISEEAGFRGYMQGGLERRFGPLTAIAVTSLIFWLAHFNHPDGVARWALLLVMAALLGALTRAAGSIWPAVACHASIDTIFFVMGASDTSPWFWRQPEMMAETGLDAKFAFFVVLLIVSAAAAVFVLRKIRESSGAQRVPANE